MKHWAHHAPMNYLHKYHLIQAETARVLGQLFEAEELYEQAIQGARDNEYLQEEALAYELAAKFYLARGREKIAQTYMQEAHYCYKRWEATAKVKDLETRYPQFFPQSSDAACPPIHKITSRTNSSHSDTAFDLAAVLKASQTISSEIELEQLLRSLMQILIENAGAQTGCLLLENSGEWVIEAACELKVTPVVAAAIQGNACGSFDWNIVENTTDWNDNYARLLGLVPGEVESSYQAWRDRVHPEDILRVEQALMLALATQSDYEAEYRVFYPDGSIHWLVGRGQGIYNAAGQPVRMLGVTLDISEQRNAALRERKRAEAASILEERNRMAREIHDTLAQAFTGILVQVGAATQGVKDDVAATQAHLEMIEELARTGLSEARRSVTALRPQLLEEGNLATALHRLVMGTTNLLRVRTFID